MHTVTTQNQVLTIKSASHLARIMKAQDAHRIKRQIPLKQGQHVLDLLDPSDRMLQEQTPLSVKTIVVSDISTSGHPHAKNNEIITLPRKRKLTPRQLLELAQQHGHTKQAQVVAAVA